MTGRATAALVLLLGAMQLLAAAPFIAQGDVALRSQRAPSPAEREFDRGFTDGDADGWNTGYADGVRCRRYYERVPRIGRRAGDGRGRHYRDGYRAAYTSAYRLGYTVGRRGDRSCRAPGRYR